MTNSKITKDRSFHRYLIQQILTNSDRVTCTLKLTINNWGSLLFTCYCQGAVKKDDKRKKKNARKEYWKQIPLPPPKMISFALCKCSKYKKSCFITSNWQKNMRWVLKLFFLAIPMLTSQKLLQKGGSGKKCCSFFGDKNGCIKVLKNWY